jgi:GNAT superfamily N-acetyltransferase
MPMKIKSAQHEDISSVVEVHISSFKGFFLTLLGKGFLAELYKAFAFRESGILRVMLDENDNVIGFAAGTAKPIDFYQSLRTDKSFFFLMKAFPSLIKNPYLVFKKLWYALFYKGEKPSTLSNSALLSSIAILPKKAGQSLGKQLLVDYESCVKSMSCDSLYLTTDKSGNDSVIEFYKRSGYVISSEFIQADGREMLTLFKKL